MKSNKQRRKEIKARRLRRAGKLAEIDRSCDLNHVPAGAIAANHEALRHNNTYGPLPLFYTDKFFVCQDCGVQQTWTAAQQKWWYEVAKGNINSTAIRCRHCRYQKRQRRAEARRIHFEGLARKQLNKH